MNFTVIFEFDEVLIKGKMLDILANLALKKRMDRDRICSELAALNPGVAPHIFFNQYCGLLLLHQQHLKATATIMCQHLSASLNKDIDFFRSISKNCYIFCPYFKDLVWPVAQLLGWQRHHIFAHSVLTTPEGVIRPYPAEHRFSAYEQLKGALSISGPVVLVSHGISCYELKRSGFVTHIWHLNEHTPGQAKPRGADQELSDFYQLRENLERWL